MYGKLFTSMFDGTLATRGPWQALVTFQQLVILADKHGEVDMTAEAISRRTTIPLEIIETGLRSLLEPDAESRSPELDGRRITTLSDTRTWGWRIVNYAHYRNMRSAEERRDYMRKYQRAYRAAKKGVNDNVNNVSEINQSSKQEAVSSTQESQSPVAAATRGSLGRARKTNGTTPPRATRLQPEWQAPDEWLDWAVLCYHLDRKHAVRISLAFRDYWIAKAGKDACKLDWQATWRNWIRRECGDA